MTKKKSDRLHDFADVLKAATDKATDAGDLVPPPDSFFLPANSRVVALESVSATNTMRKMCMLSLTVGAAIALIGVYRCDDFASLAILCSVFVVPAFGGKAAQKHIEVKGRKNEK